MAFSFYFVGLWHCLLLFSYAVDAVSNLHSQTQGKLVTERQRTSSAYWVATIERRGSVAYGNDSTYKIFRNVKDYGAKGDGFTDDTEAINKAISDGNRCGFGCDSSTVHPAIVYFPPGTYMVSTPIIMYYYTQMIGDALESPVIKALPSFYGIGILDSDVNLEWGSKWYTSQNNFWRQVRNFVLDITLTPENSGAHCIHWQVSQGTSLQNIVFNMRVGGADNNQQGILMDDGSGGMLSDLVFNGGSVGAFMGNQQFTARNFTFNNCQTAIYQNWGWVWAYKSMTFNNCTIGLDISQGGGSIQAVGSVSLQDSVFNCVTYGVVTTFSEQSMPVTGGTLLLDNVDFRGASVAIAYPDGTVILPGGKKIQSWMQGRVYSAQKGNMQNEHQTCCVPSATSDRIQRLASPPPKPSVLLDPDGKVFERSRPQYENVPKESFISVKANGAVGDGVTDDTAAIQRIFDNAKRDQIVYFDHGAYVMTDTVHVPSYIKITGECWPLIMATGPNFADWDHPRPVWRIGNPGDVGEVEMSDLIFETIGPTVGAILTEWNLEATRQGSAGMWDVHWRIGGTAGTQLQSDTCAKNPTEWAASNLACWCAFLLVHITATASLYMENNWGWVADHELDRADHGQLSLYHGRGILIESRRAVWLYGSAFEHSVLYNYQIANARAVYLSIIQAETAYMQPNPNALDPFPIDARYSDPDFRTCDGRPSCYKTWGLRIYNSSDVLVYGAGLYSFFDAYDQICLAAEACQERIVAVDRSEAVHLYLLSTKASEYMVAVDEGRLLVPASPNKGTFCETLVLFEYL